MKLKNTIMKKNTSKPNSTKINKKNYYKIRKAKRNDDYCHEEEDFESEEELENDLEDSDDEENLDKDIEKDEEEEIEVVKPKEKVDKTKFYVDPKEFDQEIMNYYKSGFMTNNLAEMVSKISHKLSFAGNFINYSYREEMVGDGIIRMMKALIAKKYDHKKGTNPFSYFTRIAFNAFRNRIKKEKHIHETHEKYQKEFMLMSESFNHLSKNNNINIMRERNRER